MRVGRINFTHDYGLAAQGAVFDPGTMFMAGSMALTAVGAGLSATSTIAGGNFARTAGEMQKRAAGYEAEQLEQNASTEIGASQRRMFEEQNKQRLVAAAATARAGASGVNAGVGSPVENQGEIARRGTYNAAMALWQGQNAATGDINKAKGVRYGGELAEMGGEAAQFGSYLSAAGTIAGGAGSMAKTYGAYTYPTATGSATARV